MMLFRECGTHVAHHAAKLTATPLMRHRRAIGGSSVPNKYIF